MQTIHHQLLKPFSHCLAHLCRNSILVVAEHNNKALCPITRETIKVGKRIGGDLTILVAGTNCSSIAKYVSSTKGVSRVLLAENEAYNGFPAENLTPLILATQEQFGFTHIIAGSTKFGKSVLPRVAAKLDVPAITDIVDVKSSNVFVRPIYAGSAFMTLQLEDHIKVITVRESGLPFSHQPGSNKLQAVMDNVIKAINLRTIPDKKHDKYRMIEYMRLKKAAESILNWEVLPGHGAPIEPAPTIQFKTGQIKLLNQDFTRSYTPTLKEAKVVICGGKGMKSPENFKLLHKLAERFNGAVGASKTAVDLGFAPKEALIGKIGTIVSPGLYIGIGVSGEGEHIAAIKDSKTIVAINDDPNAYIFEIADYGLVGDLFEILPEFIAKLTK